MKFELGNTVVVTESVLASHLIETGYSIVGKIISTRVTPSYLVEFKFVADSREAIVKYTIKEQDLAKVVKVTQQGDREYIKVEPKQGFSSQQELLEYMFQGGKVRLEDSKNIYTYENGKAVCINRRDIEVVANFSNYKEFLKYTEPKWYDNIPEQGILCWVWSSSESRKLLRVIRTYNGNKFRSTLGFWRNARPATQEEVNKLIYKG
jgi:hypothetical protein